MLISIKSVLNIYLETSIILRNVNAIYLNFDIGIHILN